VTLFPPGLPLDKRAPHDRDSVSFPFFPIQSLSSSLIFWSRSEVRVVVCSSEQDPPSVRSAALVFLTYSISSRCRILRDDFAGSPFFPHSTPVGFLFWLPDGSFSPCTSLPYVRHVRFFFPSTATLFFSGMSLRSFVQVRRSVTLSGCVHLCVHFQGMPDR